MVYHSSLWSMAPRVRSGDAVGDFAAVVMFCTSVPKWHFLMAARLLVLSSGVAITCEASIIVPPLPQAETDHTPSAGAGRMTSGSAREHLPTDQRHDGSDKIPVKIPAIDTNSS